jgi:phage tail tape-measure protein
MVSGTTTVPVVTIGAGLGVGLGVGVAFGRVGIAGAPVGVAVGTAVGVAVGAAVAVGVGVAVSAGEADGVRVTSADPQAEVAIASRSKPATPTGTNRRCSTARIPKPLRLMIDLPTPC